MVTGEQSAMWLSELIRIPSVSPAQAGARSGTGGEAQIAARVAQWFKEFGAEVVSEDVLSGRPSVYGIWRGDSSRWLALDVHTDTVGVEMMQGDPFDGRIESGKVFGRGAVDTKASLAVALCLLSEFKKQGKRLPCNLVITATADEEVGAHGAPTLARWIRHGKLEIDEMIVAEPTMCAPVFGHKGVLRLKFIIHGKTAHSSQAQLGQNAVLAGARLAVAMEKENERLQTPAFATELGSPLLTVTTLKGGIGENVVPDLCEMTIDRRIVNGESAADVRKYLQSLASQTISLPFTMDVIHEIDAFHQAVDSPFLNQLAQWTGQTPKTAPFCTNAWAYQDVVRQCVVLGPGSIDQAHGETEWIAISELDRLAKLYSRWWGISQ
jgi:acetylornithine deacetylase/succinyl-diaminopimelate desuccinylase-like protein